MATYKEPAWRYEKPIDDFYKSVIVNIADSQEKILTDRIMLVIKQQPRFIPRKVWLKLAAIFLQINHQKHVSDPRADDPVSDLVVKSREPSKSSANPPSDPKRKANT